MKQPLKKTFTIPFTHALENSKMAHSQENELYGIISYFSKINTKFLMFLYINEVLILPITTEWFLNYKYLSKVVVFLH
jgi:hypothetical protein